MAEISIPWRDVKKQIDASKDYVDDFSGRDKTKMEDLYELASKLDDFIQAHELEKGNLEKTVCLAGVTKKFIQIIKPYCSGNPKVKKALEVSEKALDVFVKGYEIVELGLALKAFDTNPGGACAAAWGGADVAKKGIDFIRYVAPNLDTDKETKKIEDRVFKLLGGGAATGAGVGALIGGAIGSLFGGVGAVPGAAIGAALGGCAGSVTGAVILALD